MSWLQALSAGASIFGGLFGGGQSSPNLNQAFGQGLQGQLGFLRQFGSQFMEQYRGMNPVFSGLEGMVLGGLSDPGRTARLEDAFQSRVYQQQAARGVQNSPTSALQSSFAGLQFGEQMRSQAMNNAFGLMTSGPYNQIFQQVAGPNLGLEQAALNSQTRQANRATMLNQLNAGLNNAFAIQGMQNQQSFQNQLMNLYGGGGFNNSGGNASGNNTPTWL